MNDWLDAEHHADRALEMFERGRWADAEAELRKALAMNPDHPEWHFNLGLTLEAAGRDREAMTSFERAVELWPGQVDPLLAAGVAACRAGEFDRAIHRLDQVIRMSPQCEPAYAHLIECYLRLDRHEDAETAFYLSQNALAEPSAACLAAMAETLLQRKAYDRAGWCLREALRLDPAMPRLRARLGTVMAATGKPQQAVQMYLRDLRDDPGNIDTLLDYSVLLMELGRVPEASEKLRRVLELEPANVDAHYRLGEIAMHARRYEQAHLEFELVYKLDSGYPEVRLSLAETLLARGRDHEARRVLQEELDRRAAGEEDDRVPANLARHGTLLLAAGMPAAAVAVLDRAVARDGESPARLRLLALARFRSGDRDGGVAASRRVLRLDQRCLASIHNLALAALEDGRLRTAAVWVSRGMHIDRHDDGIRRLRMRLWLGLARRAVRTARATAVRLLAARR
jgi:tetratricopeptide (TPR) repeat protein